MTQPINWIKNPNTTQLLLVIAASIIGTGLLLFAITDEFTHFSFSKKHILIYAFILGSIWTAGEVAYHYFKNRK